MLTARVFAKVLCRVLALGALLFAVVRIFQTVEMFRNGIEYNDWDYAFLTGLMALFPLALLGIAIWLWIKAATVAAWMLDHNLQDEPDEPDEHPAPVSPADAHRVILAVIGTSLILLSVPQLIGWGAYTSYHSLRSGIRETDFLQAMLSSVFLCQFFWLVFAFLLFFASRALVKFIWRAHGFREITTSWSPDVLQLVLISSLGVSIVAFTLPLFISILLTWFVTSPTLSEYGVPGSPMSWEILFVILGCIVALGWYRFIPLPRPAPEDGPGDDPGTEVS